MRAMAISAAGHVLVATANGHKAVHALAADDGLDGIGDDFAGDERIFHASVPIEMPSEMVMVLKMIALPPASFAPASASRASLSMCMLQGVTMLQVEAMPMMRLGKILGLEADGVKHGAARGAFGAIEDDAGMGAEGAVS